MATHNRGVPGERSGSLTAVRETSKTKGKSGARKWLFKCDCGGEITHQLSAVRTGRYASCGCKPPTRTQRAILFQERFGVCKFEASLLAVRVEGVCDICGEPETRVHHKTGLIQFLSVDHCHKTGTVRGVLCRMCNIAEGHLRSLQNARKLVEYLERAGALAKTKST